MELATQLLGFRKIKNCQAALDVLYQYADKDSSEDILWSAVAEIESLMIARSYVHPRLGAERALSAARQALRLNQYNASALAVIGWIDVVINNEAAAFNLLERARELAPQNSRNRYYSGWALASLGRLREAAEEAKLSVEFAGPVPVTGAAAGLLLFLAGLPDEAAALLRRSIRALPWDDSAYFFQSILTSELGDHQGALSQINRAIELDGGESVVYRAYAAYYLAKLGRREEAKVLLERILLERGSLPPNSGLVRMLFELEGESAARAMVAAAEEAGCPHRAMNFALIKLNPVFAKLVEGKAG